MLAPRSAAALEDYAANVSSPGNSLYHHYLTVGQTVGAATAGPFTVTVPKASTDADISAVLSCPASMTVGGTGTCTLTVANAGPGTASKVVAGVRLPFALSEVSCTSGCARHANVFTWTLAALASGASAKFSITAEAHAAGRVLVLAWAASQSPDPNPRNNISIQRITIGHRPGPGRGPWPWPPGPDAR